MSEPLVLVAEDDASVRLTIELVLQVEGFDVVCAEDGEQAVRIAQEAHPDVILLDQVMPRMDGKSAFAILKQNASTSDIPVFVLTGMADGDEQWPGAHFIGKPFSPDHLVERIRNVLS